MTLIGSCAARVTRLGLVLACLTLAACMGRTRPDSVAAPDVPAAFDMTVLADKDGQFDLDGATLAAEDLRDHLRYRSDQHQAVRTLLLKRSEKQKVTDRHVAGLARIGVELNIRTYVQDKDGAPIDEIRANAATKDARAPQLPPGTHPDATRH